MTGVEQHKRFRLTAARLRITPAALRDMRGLRLSLGDLLLIVSQGERSRQEDAVVYSLPPDTAAPRRWRALLGVTVRVESARIMAVTRLAQTASGDEQNDDTQ